VLHISGVFNRPERAQPRRLQQMPLEQTHSHQATVEAAFPVFGGQLPIRHGSALFTALCELPDLRPWLPTAEGIAIAPVSGDIEGDQRLTLNETSRLLVRLPSAELPRILGLVGRSLMVDGQGLDLGEPKVELPRPAASLQADIVIFDGATSARAAFADRVKRGLSALEIASQWELGDTGTLHLRGGAQTGFALHVTGLTAEDSLHLQEAGLGDYRKLGCGVFLPARR
jgi:CRISPR-associated protein Cas6